MANSPTKAALTVANQEHLLLSFGTPTFQHCLYYQTLYAAKPFVEAILYYYDNGLYKILSPGEEHYGVYVLSGSFTDKHYTIRYISLPATDWGNKTAYHYLEFTAGAIWQEGGVYSAADY